MEYKIVTKSSVNDIEKAVNELIKAGWEPIGGVAYSPGGYYYQAMIKKQ